MEGGTREGAARWRERDEVSGEREGRGRDEVYGWGKLSNGAPRSGAPLECFLNSNGAPPSGAPLECFLYIAMAHQP